MKVIGINKPLVFGAFCSLAICLLTLENTPIDVFLIGFIFILTKILIHSKKINPSIPGLLSVISVIYIFFYKYTSLLNIEACISLLVILQGEKFLEVNQKRDLFIFFNILILIIVGQVLYNQSLFTTISSITCFILVIYGFLLIECPDFEFKVSTFRFWKLLIKYFLIITPFVLSLFFLFPRYESGFRSVNKGFAQSGFSPEAQITGVNSIQLSDQIIFRAKFESTTPKMNELYWNGSVLYETDSSNWFQKSSFPRSKPLTTLNSAKTLKYTIYLEQIMQEYLFTLDRPIDTPLSPFSIKKLGEKTFKLYRSNPKKFFYTGLSQNSQVSPQITNSQKSQATNLPVGISKKIIHLSKKLKGSSAKQSISNILNYFSKNNFLYSLQPGPTNNLDDFLFKNKKGFCTHFSSATAVLARLMNIPTRLITGFQGGQFNPFTNQFIVRQKDAHAWIEYYDHGWIRLDPIAIIQPARIELGADNFFSASVNGEDYSPRNINHSKFRKWLQNSWFYLDKINIQWENFLRGFDKDFQKKLMQKWGGRYDQLIYYSIGIPILLFLVFSLSYIFRYLLKKDKESIEDLIYLKFQKLIEKKGLKKPKHFSPNEYLALIESMPLNIIDLIRKFIELYLNIKYSFHGSLNNKEEKQEKLKQLYKNIRLNLS